MSLHAFDSEPDPLRQRDAVTIANDIGRSSARGPAAPHDRTDVVCRGCGYGAVVSAVPTRCPMCAAASWMLAGSGRRTVLELCLGR